MTAEPTETRVCTGNSGKFLLLPPGPLDPAADVFLTLRWGKHFFRNGIFAVAVSMATYELRLVTNFAVNQILPHLIKFSA